MSGWLPHGRRSVLWLYVPNLVLAGGVLLLIGWVLVTLWFYPYLGMQWSWQTGYVERVDQGGAAQQAGLRNGDQVVAIQPAFDFSLAGNNTAQQVHKHMIITMVRGQQPFDVALVPTIPSLSIRLLRWEPLLAGVIFWCVALIAWVLRPVHVVPRLFFLLSQAVVITLAALSLTMIHSPYGLHAGRLAVTLLAPLMLHFFAQFPEPLPVRLRRLLLWYGYGGASLLILLMLVPSWPQGGLSSTLVQHCWRVFTVVTALGALALLFRRHKGVPLQVLRRQRLLVAGGVVSVTPLLLCSFLPELVQGTTVVSYAWTSPFLVVLPFTFAYAIHQGELGRIDLLLNRSLVYLMLSMMVLALYVVLFRVGYQQLPPKHWGRPVLNTTVALIVAILYGPLWARLQQSVDRFFYTGWYDYRTVMRTASSNLSHAKTLEQLVAQLMAVAQTMRFQTAVLLWPEGDTLVVRGFVGYQPTTVPCWQIPVQGVLARYLLHHGYYHWRETVSGALGTAKDHLTDAERSLLSEKLLPVWLTLWNPGGLQGVLLLGKRPCETLLDGEDVDMLVTLAGQASVAAENVTLVEALRKRLTQVEVMRDELTEVKRRLFESREAERLHLAQELHDGPVQDLYGACFRLESLAQTVRDQAEQARLGNALALLEQVTRTLRTICGELRPPTLAPFGLEAAIRSHATSFQEVHPELNLDTDLTRDGQTLPERVRLALFRIYQEALHNMAQHACARRVLIRLRLDAEHVVLEVQDNGCGFTVPQRWLELARQGHLGLLGAAERVEALGGQLEVISEPGQGTLVRAIAPCSIAQVITQTAVEKGVTYGPDPYCSS